MAVPARTAAAVPREARHARKRDATMRSMRQRGAERCARYAVIFVSSARLSLRRRPAH